MNLFDVHICREVARRGSFAAAARAMDVDPSAVSRAVAALETRLGARLFDRTTRRVSITEAGSDWLARVDPLLEEFADAEEALRDRTGSVTGRLRISASTAFGDAMIVPMLGPFLDAHPDLEVDLRLTDAQVDIIGDRVDVAVRLSADAPPDTVLIRLVTTRYRVVAAPSYLARRSLGRPEDLGDHACLRFAIPGLRDRWTCRSGGEIREITIGGRLEILGAHALRRAAVAGLGPALLADWLVRDDIKRGALIDCFPDVEWAGAGSFDTAAWGLTPSRRYRPRKTTAFIDALRAHLRKTLAAA